MTIKDEIAVFFTSYVDAFSRGDIDALCTLWEPVGLFPTAAGNFAMDAQTFRGHLVKLMNFYKTQGVIRPESRLLDATELFPNVAQARMAYRMLGSSDELIASWEHFYILRRKDRWQISLAIADGEMSAWGPRLSEF